MPVVRPALLAVVLVTVLCASASAVSLPVNQRFTDSKDRVSMITRSGGKGYVTARTRCGRFASARVRISGGRLSSLKGARYRLTGVVTSRSTLKLTVRRRGCVTAFSLRRVTKPE